MTKSISYSFNKWEKLKKTTANRSLRITAIKDTITNLSSSFKQANEAVYAYSRVLVNYSFLAEETYVETANLEEVLYCLDLIGKYSYQIICLSHQYPQLEAKGSWRSIRLDAPLCLAGRWEEAATAIKLRNDRYKTRINSGNVSKEEYERYFEWDTITCLMIEQDFIQAQQAIQKFRAEGKDNIRDRTDFFEGIISGDFDEVTAVARLYLTAYEAIINRDEKLLNDSVQKLLKHYRTQTSVNRLNLWVLMLEKIAVHAGLNIDVDVVEAPKTLLFLTLDHNKVFDIPQTDFPLEETVKRLVEQGSVATKPAMPMPPIVVEKPAAPAAPAQSLHADPVLAAMNQIDQKEKSLSLYQKKLWCMLSLARFNTVLCACAPIVHLEPLAGITAVIDACEAYLVSGEKYRVPAVSKFLRGIGKILDEEYLDDCEMVLEAEFRPAYLVNSMQEMESFVRVFDGENIAAARFLLSTILEDYNYDYLYDHWPETGPSPQDVEIERVWEDLEFVLTNPFPEEIAKRIEKYKNVDLRNPAINIT